MPTSSPGRPPLQSKVPLEEMHKEAGAITRSLCETCALMREINTPKGSRFLLCQLSQTHPNYPKYPPQPVVRCGGYQKKEHTREVVEMKQRKEKSVLFLCTGNYYRSRFAEIL